MSARVTLLHRPAGSLGWWSAKARQSRRHVLARVSPSERVALATWLTPAQLALFDAMHVADRRHGLDVVATLRAHGVTARDVLVAGLLHDCGKGDVGLWPRVAWSLSEVFGVRLLSVFRALPGLDPALDRLRDHAAESARLAASVGCTPRAVALIREQAEPSDPEFGEIFRAADEAN